MKFFLLPLGICCFLWAADDLEAVKHQIQVHNQTHLKGLIAGDPEACASIYAPDTLILYPGRPPLSGNEGVYRERRRAFDKARVLDGSLELISLEISGEMAYEIGTFSYTIQALDQNEARIVKGKYIVIWQRQPDGRWLRKVDAGLPD